MIRCSLTMILDEKLLLIPQKNLDWWDTPLEIFHESALLNQEMIRDNNPQLTLIPLGFPSSHLHSS